MKIQTIKGRLIGITLLATLAVAAMWVGQRLAVKAVAELEAAGGMVHSLNAGMLTLRRDEKDFLARIDMKYRDKFQAHHTALRQRIERLGEVLRAYRLSTATLDAFGRVVDDYRNDFNALVAAQERVGMSPKTGLYGALRKAVHDAEGLLGELDQTLLTKDMLMLRRREKDFMLREDPKYVEKFHDDFAIFHQDLEATALSAEGKARLVEYMESYRRDFIALAQGYREMGLNSDQGLRGAMRATIHRSETLLDTLTTEIEGEVRRELARRDRHAALLALFTLLALSLLIILTARGINRRVEGLRGVIQRASDQLDLGLRYRAGGNDEIAAIGGAFNTMLERFHASLSRVMRTSTRVNDSAGELATVTQQTHDGARRQRIESEQAASAMEQMTATIREVARNAEAAAQASRDAEEASRHGVSVMGGTVAAIRQMADELEGTSSVIASLEKESENIGTVLSVIQGIADQTNLLALNAAIEAARAGDSGRGFAVVADEVRQLAQRSRESTDQIRSIIERLQQGARDAVSTMEGGRDKARGNLVHTEKAGAALQTIIDAVSTISKMNEQIAAAAEEQSTVAETIGRNVASISVIADQTESGAGHTSSTSGVLSELAGELRTVVNHFKMASAEA